MSNYNLNVKEVARLLREYLKNNYPNYKFSVTYKDLTDINVDLYEADFDAFVTDVKNAKVDSLKIATDKNLTDDAKRVLQVIMEFIFERCIANVTMNVGRNAIPYKKIDKKSYPSKGGFSSSTPPKYDKGTLIRTCGGWELFKATTKNGKVVYNAYKLASTPLNKLEWNVIKGDIYTQTGFKYQYNAFTKWGEIDDKRIDRLCELLDKYYTSQGTGNVPTKTPTTQSQTTPQSNTNLITAPYYLKFIELEDADNNEYKFYSFEDFNKNLPPKGSIISLNFTFITTKFVYIYKLKWQYDSIEDYINRNFLLLNSELTGSRKDDYIFEFQPATPTQKNYKKDDELFNIVRKYFNSSKTGFSKKRKLELVNLNHAHAIIEVKRLNNKNIMDEIYQFYIEPSTTKQNTPTTTPTPQAQTTTQSQTTPQPIEKIESISFYNKVGFITGRYETFEKCNKNLPKLSNEYQVKLRFSDGFEIKFDGNYWHYKSIEEFLKELIPEFYENELVKNSDVSYLLIEDTPQLYTTKSTTPKVLTKDDYQRRIKGIEALLKFETNQEKIDKFNRKIKGINALLKFS